MAAGSSRPVAIPCSSCSTASTERCAVLCKVQQQVPIYDGDQPPDRAIRFRIGINIGDAIADGTDLHGDAVNVAARLQAECPPGGICVSRPVRDHVQDRLDLAFEELGALNLKNIARPVEAFVVAARQFDTDRIGIRPAIARSAMRLKSCRCPTSPRSPCSHSPTWVATSSRSISPTAWRTTSSPNSRASGRCLSSPAIPALPTRDAPST